MKKKPQAAKDVLREQMLDVRQYLIDRMEWHISNAERLREAVDALGDYSHDESVNSLMVATKTFLALSETEVKKTRRAR